MPVTLSKSARFDDYVMPIVLTRPPPAIMPFERTSPFSETDCESHDSYW